MTGIVPFKEDHWPAIWQFMEPVFRAGETYPYPVDISEQEARQFWIDKPVATYVALNADENPVGTYYILANQPGLGDHVCNCGYIVSPDARGTGLASAMCKHSQGIANELDFLAMQYNLVVSTNDVAVRVWQRNGFEIIGTLPDAFRSTQYGLVDAYVMYKLL